MPPVQVLEEAVDLLHTKFYDAIEQMYAQHAPTFSNYKELKFVMC